MRKLKFMSFSVVLLLFACKSKPENYEKGMVCYNSKKYEEAIKHFKLTPREELEWVDSSRIMINKSVNGLFKTNDLSRITIFCRNNQSDTLVNVYIGPTIKNYWRSNIESKSLFCFNLFDSVRFLLSGEIGIDTLVRKTEDAFFKGIWKCNKGSLDGHEIYFNRDENTKLINGLSNKSINGWDLGKVMYKDIYYIGNNKLDHKVRVFESGGYSYFFGYIEPSEYFTNSKGSMSIISQDSILIDYEGSVNSGSKKIFIRQKF